MLVSRNEQAVRLHHRMVGFAKCLLEIEARKEERLIGEAFKVWSGEVWLIL